MLHRKKLKIKAVFVGTLGYLGTPDTMAHLAEMAEMDSEVTKVIQVSLQEKNPALQLHYMHILKCLKLHLYNL